MPTTTKISAQFATSLSSPEHIAMAEQLGYDRAWLFDTPHESPDVWMMLALAAERTTTIGLGPGVLVPTLRHPMVNASATTALTALAPGRVAVAFGTGFAGARALGAAPTSWTYLREYVAAFRGLLTGATVTWHFDQASSPHNVVSLSTPEAFNSGTPKGKGTYSFTFTTPGTYPYLCQVHPTMRGTIVVTP